MTTSRFPRVLCACLIAAIAAFVGSGVSMAQSPAGGPTVLTLFLPTVPVAVGDRFEAAVTLTDLNGKPIANAVVTLTSTVVFMNAGGDVVVGRVVTDAQGRGLAVLAPRTDGQMVVNAQFAGDPAYTPSLVTTSIAVLPGPAQFHYEGGVGVPGVGVYLLVLLLGAVYTTYLVVMGLVTRIASAGTWEPTDERGQAS